MQISKEELQARSVTVKFTKFTTDQLNIRRKIAAHMVEHLLPDQKMDGKLCETYKKMSTASILCRRMDK